MIFLFVLNVAYMFFLWHMDVNHNLDKLGENKTRGIFKIRPEFAYRLSQYGLIAVLLLIDLLILIAE